MSLLMLLPLLGGALFLRRILDLSDSSSILTTVSGVLLLTYVAGLLGVLQAGAYLLAGLGLLLLVWELWKIILSRNFFFSFPSLLFLLLPILYWLVHAESKPMFWDEYSHWGIYIREMAVTHTFYTGDTNASHPDYPPGSAVWQYFWTLIPGYSEGDVYLAQFILLMTPLLVLFETLTLRQCLWVPALLGLCALGLANFGHGIVSLYTDHMLSVWFTGVMLHGLYSRKKSLLETGMLALPLAVILLIKDAGLPLVASALFLIICLLLYRHFREHKRFVFQPKMLITILILVAIPFVVQATWKLNRSLEGIASKQEGTGLIQVLLSGKSRLNDEEMQIYRQHFLEVFSNQQFSRNEISMGFNEFNYRLMPYFKDEFKLTLMGLFLIIPIWSGILLLFSDPKHRFEYVMCLGILYFTALAYLFIMYRTYPLIHSVERAQNLVSFLRYAHSFTLPMVLIGFGLLAPVFQYNPNYKSGTEALYLETYEDLLNQNYDKALWVKSMTLSRGEKKIAKWRYIELKVEKMLKQPHLLHLSHHFSFAYSSLIFFLGISLLFTFETPYLKPFYTTVSFANYPNNIALRWRKDMDGMATKIKKTVGNSRLWIHLPLADNGFLATALRYQMTPIPTTINKDPKLLEQPEGKIAKLWKDFDYLWLPIRNPYLDLMFHKKFGTTNSELLKVTNEEDHISIKGVTISPSS